MVLCPGCRPAQANTGSSMKMVLIIIVCTPRPLPARPRYSPQPCDVDPFILRDSGVNLIHLKEEGPASSWRSHLWACQAFPWTESTSGTVQSSTPLPAMQCLSRAQHHPGTTPTAAPQASSLVTPEGMEELRNSHVSTRKAALSCFLCMCEHMALGTEPRVFSPATSPDSTPLLNL